MKKARITLALMITCSITAGLLAFKVKNHNGLTFYCTTQYAAPGKISIYPTIALPTTAFCTTRYNYTCYTSIIVSFDFPKN